MDIIPNLNVIDDINVIEKDIENVNENCKKINCGALFNAIRDTIKLIIDSVACCFKYCKPKKE
jgi:hypothetical protein